MSIFTVPTKQDLSAMLVFCNEADTHDNRSKLHFGLVIHTRNILRKTWGMYKHINVKDQMIDGIIIADLMERYNEGVVQFHNAIAEDNGWYSVPAEYGIDTYNKATTV